MLRTAIKALSLFTVVDMQIRMAINTPLTSFVINDADVYWCKINSPAPDSLAESRHFFLFYTFFAEALLVLSTYWLYALFLYEFTYVVVLLCLPSDVIFIQDAPDYKRTCFILVCSSFWLLDLNVTSYLLSPVAEKVIYSTMFFIWWLMYQLFY